MDTLRSWFALFVCVPATILCSTAAILALALPRRAQAVQAVCRLWAWIWCVCAGVRVEVSGAQNLPKGSSILVSNHQSHFDVPALFLAIRQPILFMAKRSLFRLPFLGWAMKLVGHIPVDRGEFRKGAGALDEAAAKIRKGKAGVLVFAEGRRSGGPTLQPFKSGAFVLAVESGVPLVPIAVNGGYKVHLRGDAVIHPGTIRVKILKPVSPSGLSLEDAPALKQQAYEAIEEALR